MEPAAVDLPAGGGAKVRVDITVPTTATTGERYEGLVAALPRRWPAAA